MRSRCSERTVKNWLFAGCLSVSLLASSVSIAFAFDGDGATLPPPAKKPITSTNTNSSQNQNNPVDNPPGKNRPRRHRNDDDAPPGMDGGKGPDGHMGPPPGGPGGPGGPAGGSGNGERMLSALDLTALNLTDDQKQKIKQLRQDNVAKARELHRKTRDASDALRDIMFDATTTDAQIKAKSDEVKKAHEQYADCQINFFLGMRALLTPEQKAKLKDVKAALEKKMAEQHQHHGGPFGGPPGGDKPDGKKGPQDPGSTKSEGKRPQDIRTASK